MTDHNQLTDAEFVDRIRNASLDPALFTHEAHLRLGWILVRENGAEQAAEILCAWIADYARAIGKAEKFDRAVTIAATQVLAVGVVRSRATDHTGFMAEFPKLRSHFGELIAAYNEGGVGRVEQVL